MLTSRGWWLLVIALAQVVIGLILSERVGPLIALIGLVVLTWFAMEWALFQTRVSLAVPRLKVTRLLRSDGRETPIVWAGQPFEVIVDAVLSSRLSLPYLTLQDRPPSGCERLDGRDDLTISLQPNESISIRYSLRCDSPGEIRFEGVRLQLADIQGLFYHRAFLRQPAIYLVLPPLADAKGNRRTSKSHNVMPPPGLHRLRQAGGGSELHDLREYRPGDPPKMIAWKAMPDAIDSLSKSSKAMCRFAARSSLMHRPRCIRPIARHDAEPDNDDRFGGFTSRPCRPRSRWPGPIRR